MKGQGTAGALADLAACVPVDTPVVVVQNGVERERLALAEQEGLVAAGVDVASEQEDAERRGNLLTLRLVRGRAREGGSSWQRLARGTGAVETDTPNGEVVLLGRLHGVSTPVNALLQRLANALARRHAPPGSVTEGEFLALLP